MESWKVWSFVLVTMHLLFFEICKIGLQFTEEHGTLQRPDNPHRDGFPYPQPGDALIRLCGLEP